MQRTRRSCRDLLAVTTCCLSVVVVVNAASVPAAVPLACSISSPANVLAGQAVQLHLTLSNTGGRTVDVLTWGTPFEGGWFAPFVTLRRGGQGLAYGGASVKRGEPRAQDYLRLEPGQSRQADIDLSLAFDTRTPGRYQVTPQIVLHDVVQAGQEPAPRPRERHAGQALNCGSLEFTVSR